MKVRKENCKEKSTLQKYVLGLSRAQLSYRAPALTCWAACGCNSMNRIWHSLLPDTTEISKQSDKQITDCQPFSWISYFCWYKPDSWFFSPLLLHFFPLLWDIPNPHWNPAKSFSACVIHLFTSFHFLGFVSDATFLNQTSNFFSAHRRHQGHVSPLSFSFAGNSTHCLRDICILC